jgi:hypothetical protein
MLGWDHVGVEIMQRALLYFINSHEGQAKDDREHGKAQTPHSQRRYQVGMVELH